MCALIEADMAWDSKVRPREIVFEDIVPDCISKKLITVFSSQIKIDRRKGYSLTSLKPVQDLAGHYCLQCGDMKWFLRVTRRKRKNQEIEDIVAVHLKNAGVDVALPIISGLSIQWKRHNYLVAIFPFIEGRHFNGSNNDLISLSKTLSLLHKALKTFKYAKRVYSASLNTAGRIAESKNIVAHAIRTKDFSVFYERAQWAKRNLNWIKKMVECFNPYLCLLPKSQCVHGELHLGNVIFSLDGSKAFIVDFEETPDAWFPRSFDIAYVVHRFCLDQNPSRVLLSKRLDIIKHHYGALPHDLKEMMRQVCWYNIALLVDRSARRESISPEGEYDKFVNLEKMTNNML